MEEEPVVVENPVVEAKRVQFNCDIPAEDKQVIDQECEKLGLTRANYIHMLINKKDSVPEKTEEDIPTRKKLWQLSVIFRTLRKDLMTLRLRRTSFLTSLS